MPAGVSWGQYLGFTVAALVSMGVGAQVVHRFYQPLHDLEEYIDREYQERMKKMQLDSTKSSSS